mgnify:CR=1 FL=1
MKQIKRYTMTIAGFFVAICILYFLVNQSETSKVPGNILAHSPGMV